MVAGLALSTGLAQAGPWVDQGDVGLRHDLQLLADGGVLTVPLTTWPLAWGDLIGEINAAESAELNPAEYAALKRVQRRMRAETRLGSRARFRASWADNPVQLRTFEATPREEEELSAGLEWTGERFAFRAQGTVVKDPQDDESTRLDGSYAGVALGNWMLSANALDRWWGPGWEASQILSNNARPIPAVMIERNSSRPFKTPWLSWLGPWKLVVFNGFLEKERNDYAEPMLFGARFTFKPWQSLELGLSRTAMWGGDGRPQDWDAFWNMLIGNDNRNQSGTSITSENEPGNQLAGYDLRWAPGWPSRHYAVYAQYIGEDEKNHLPYRFLDLLGAEFWGGFSNGWSWRVHAEYTETRAESTFDYAYNHAIYTDGYRYYGRCIGNSMDNDGRQRSLGLTLADTRDGVWSLLLRSVELNGDDDGLNSLTPIELYMTDVHVSHQRDLFGGRLSLGLGWYELEDPDTHETDDDTNAYVQWSMNY